MRFLFGFWTILTICAPAAADDFFDACKFDCIGKGTVLECVTACSRAAADYNEPKDPGYAARKAGEAAVDEALAELRAPGAPRVVVRAEDDREPTARVVDSDTPAACQFAAANEQDYWECMQALETQAAKDTSDCINWYAELYNRNNSLAHELNELKARIEKLEGAKAP